MLSPEVWQFPPPKSASRVRTNASEENLIREISDHNFYHNIFVLCADTNQDIPVQLENVFEDSSYYKLNDCKLSELLTSEFIEGYIQKGSFYCLSIGKDASIENVVTVTSQDGFTLVLDSQSYHSLGIQGKQFRRVSGHSAYYININLKDGLFKSQKKSYNHTHAKLEAFDTFALLVHWEPDDERACPSSIAKYFVERGLQVECCTPKLATKRQHVTHVPKPDNEHIDELVEWMGMIAVGGDLNPENGFISMYEYDTNNCTAEGFITAFHISGLFTPQFVLQLRKLIRETILAKNMCRWVGLTVQCFTDAPSLRGLQQMKNRPPEDCLLTLVMNEKEIVFNSFKSY